MPTVGETKLGVWGILFFLCNFSINLNLISLFFSLNSGRNPTPIPCQGKATEPEQSSDELFYWVGSRLERKEVRGQGLSYKNTS